MTNRQLHKASPPAEGPVLAKAVLRAAEHLGLTARVLGAIVGLSEPTVSRLKKGEFDLERGTKPFELAVLLVRLYRSLDAIVGGDDTVAKAWLRNDNIALGGKPIDKIQTVSGIVDAIAYLDARRAIV
ncbi:antitoxin Xre-like helix-turn-helix domain-containing protein [Beijerinckia mobilis]|uniref:antitoxin Xre-like helix-turn-helix domain-containing protein n=1 Tax=Beijerinckia mobilis TaxID=231434 RepID=UPI000555E97E|nr:antitoxin Xre-like helix-turn-helix domain-containing protein [Beijerinckia mobilis]